MPKSEQIRFLARLQLLCWSAFSASGLTTMGMEACNHTTSPLNVRLGTWNPSQTPGRARLLWGARLPFATRLSVSSIGARNRGDGFGLASSEALHPLSSMCQCTRTAEGRVGDSSFSLSFELRDVFFSFEPRRCTGTCAPRQAGETSSRHSAAMPQLFAFDSGGHCARKGCSPEVVEDCRH